MACGVGEQVVGWCVKRGYTLIYDLSDTARRSGDSNEKTETRNTDLRACVRACVHTHVRGRARENNRTPQHLQYTFITLC